MQAVGEQQRQLIVAEHGALAPPHQQVLVHPGGEPGGRRLGPDRHPGVGDPRVVIGGDHPGQVAPHDQLVDRGPGPLGHRILARREEPAQQRVVGPIAELFLDDADHGVRPARRQLTAGPQLVLAETVLHLIDQG